MNITEAKAVIALLSAGFPRDPMPPSTVSLWASKLTAYDYDDAEQAARDVVEAFDRMPSLKTFTDAIYELRKHRWASVALPAGPVGGGIHFAEFVAQNPDVRERIEAMQGSLMGDLFAGILERELGK